MATKDSELRVVRRSRDGRRRYDENGKRALIEAALQPGMSVARLAQEHGINANLLRKWITKYLMERESAESSGAQDSHAVESEAPRTIGMVDVMAIDTPGTAMRNVPPESAPSAFVPVVAAPPVPLSVPAAPSSSSSSMAVALHVRLSNGVEFDLGEASIDELTAVVQMLGRMPCSGSTKG
ncbi:transposase [Paraburkholderia sp. MM5384-R2]|uniref:transposase n=1 Tax=Paraburkholderia sp. MM5384-R2 TaxID=2723097 RepID=UPI0016107203|nr:transposase [Paraburkholderia sp. MM5384-R2]MBB5503123.1 transposase [Paraburkholderia sp. MM5384-R2]